MKDDRLGVLGTPILVKYLRAVLGGDEIAGHGSRVLSKLIFQ
jgi:hypothetical protein